AVLVTAARSAEEVVLAGVDLGAGVSVTKPYGPRELMARVRPLLRRTRRPAARAADTVLRAGPLAVDPSRHTVHFDGVPVDCTPGEFQLLAALAARPGHVFT